MKKRLHVVYKTHLDIGFTDLAENVINQYLYEFIPKALELGEKLPDKFTWTTGSWLIDYYLNHPDISETDKQRMREAIKKGTIRWHGLPYTIHTELMDKELVRYALSISQKLDKEFNKKTIASKMTDIPGHTISLVPYLKEAGIEYIHIGVNASSAIPKIPKMFVWKAPDGSDVIVHYAMDYGEVFDYEEWPDALYFAHSHDNMGPPSSVEEVESLFNMLEEEYPDYDIMPSSLDAFAESILKFKETLPVIEEEIGDSWIHGISTDPKKISDYRKMLELRTKWLADGKLEKHSEAYQNFSAHLLLVAEHTWGVNGNVYLPEYRHFALDEFSEARNKDLVEFNHDRGTMDYADLMSYISTDIDWDAMKDRRRYSLYEASWQEQRDYITKAIEALPTTLQKEAYQEIELEKINELVSSKEAIVPGKIYSVGNVEFSFSLTGGLNHLVIDKQKLIETGKEFGGLSYERFDFSNYSTFFSQYSRLTRWTTGWAMGDFGRRGIESHPEIRYELIKPYIQNSSIEIDGQLIKIGVSVSYQKGEIKKWGLPSNNQLMYVIDIENQQIDLTYQWENKQANRMPESYWLETSINVSNPSRWQAEKLGHPISPLNVIENGNRNMHVLSTEGLSYQGYEGSYQLQTFDAPLVSFGRRSLLKFDNKLPDLNEGIFINLFNNVWGTNFAAWYEGDMIYRLSFKWQTNNFL